MIIFIKFLSKFKKNLSEFKVNINQQDYNVCISQKDLRYFEELIIRYISKKSKVILITLFIEQKIEKKYVYVGDINSINIEIICKSHNSLKNKINYILLGNYKEISNYIKKISSKLKLNEITDPIKFDKYKQNCLNIFNIENISNKNI